MDDISKKPSDNSGHLGNRSALDNRVFLMPRTPGWLLCCIIYLSNVSYIQVADLLYGLRCVLTQRPGQHEDLIVARVVELLATVTSLLHLTTLHTAANQLRGQCRSRRWVESREYTVRR